MNCATLFSVVLFLPVDALKTFVITPGSIPNFSPTCSASTVATSAAADT